MSKASEIDFVVVGAGVAGLRAAVELARHGDVLVVTKESLKESNTHYAQGGIAVAMEGDEDVSLHLEDTIKAGDGLVYRPAAEVLVSEGPLRVAELIEWGAKFDREGNLPTGELLRTREGAHSLPRILHASGDATGAEISRSLVAFARAHKRIRFAEWAMVTGLVADGPRVAGVDLAPARAGTRGDETASHLRVAAKAVLIAAGGAGQVYSDTTNPAVATGDGIALAEQAGAELADMEFYQFHPTAFYLQGAPRFLLSEALRGEGAYLINDKGVRFMERYHPLLELAPRDVVARAIAHEALNEDGTARPVYLDMRHVTNLDVHARFPGISAFLAKYSLDLARDPVPVRPAAHYLMGGIKSDLAGRTSLKGLYAAGEAACTGVHGANRLASNSLLEGLVFGARAAQSMLEDGLPPGTIGDTAPTPAALTPCEESRVEETVTELQRAMWATAGLLRKEGTLRQGLDAQKIAQADLMQIAEGGKASRRLTEALALAHVAHAILHSALARTESRGAHFRSDFPKPDDERFRRHSVLRRDGRVKFEEW
jgi:L-aspartate oxidase